MSAWKSLIEEENIMVTYQYLYTFVIVNLVIVGTLFLLGKVSKKAWAIIELLIAVCWAAFSWYYQLRLSKHLPSNLYDKHAFLGLFMSVVYNLGCYLSIMFIFFFSIVVITQLLSPDVSFRKQAVANGNNHSPWPLWIAGIAVGLLSAIILNASLIPGLNKLMDAVTKLIYVKLFSMKASFPAYYIPAAGIAAGTLITACFSSVYRRSRVPFACFLSLVLVPVLTAVFAPLVDFAGSIMVLVLVIAAYVMKDDVDVPVRNPVPYILLAIGIGALSGLYFYANGLVVISNSKAMTIVGGVVSGITIACLASKSFSCESSIFRALYFLAFIPFCTPGFSSAVAYLISLVAAFIFLCMGMSAGRKPIPLFRRSHMRTEHDDLVIDSGYGSIEFNENGQTVSAESASLDGATYTAMDGREYERRGNRIYRTR